MSRKVSPSELPFETVTLSEAAVRDARATFRHFVFTTNQAPGAIDNGARVRKVVMEAGDFHPIGAVATVVGSVGPIEGEIGYFVQWDDVEPLVFIRGRKIEMAE